MILLSLPSPTRSDLVGSWLLLVAILILLLILALERLPKSFQAHPAAIHSSSLSVQPLQENRR
jgi:hypothetical protein